MAILSFIGMTNIAVGIVKEYFPNANLYEVFGVSSRGWTRNWTDIDQLNAVFGVMLNKKDRSARLCSEKWGEWGPVVLGGLWVEDMVIAWPIKLDLEEAVQLMYSSGYTGTFNNTTLRWPVGPGYDEPYYIFHTPDRYIFVGVNSHEVTARTTSPPPSVEAQT